MSNSEPVWTTAGVTAAAAAIVGLLVAFGLPLTGDQQAAILGVVGVVAPLIVALVARNQVTPNTNVVAFRTSDGPVAGDASPIKTGTPVDVAKAA